MLCFALKDSYLPSLVPTVYACCEDCLTGQNPYFSCMTLCEPTSSIAKIIIPKLLDTCFFKHVFFWFATLIITWMTPVNCMTSSSSTWLRTARKGLQHPYFHEDSRPNCCDTEISSLVPGLPSCTYSGYSVQTFSETANCQFLSTFQRFDFTFSSRHSRCMSKFPGVSQGFRGHRKSLAGNLHMAALKGADLGNSEPSWGHPAAAEVGLVWEARRAPK